MSGLKDKILGKTGGSAKALTNGSKLPATGPLKENNPEQGTVRLNKLWTSAPQMLTPSRRSTSAALLARVKFPLTPSHDSC